MIEGPCGAGKTALTRGRGLEDPEDAHHDCLLDRGFDVYDECGSRTMLAMKRDGRPHESFMQEAYERILALELERHERANAQSVVCFFDRGFLGYEMMKGIFGIKETRRVRELYDVLRKRGDRYAQPVVMLEPVPDFDLSAPREGQKIPERQFTMEQRLEMLAEAARIYQGHGYDVVTIPPSPPGAAGTSNEHISWRVDEIVRVTVGEDFEAAGPGRFLG